MRLSLCMIVKNEADNLPNCLASVQGVVDEIVVLDTGSTDRTVEIAQDFGARVEYFVWCDDFSAARNAALQYVTGDWVLVLDADEALTPTIGPVIRQAIETDRAIVINLIRQEIGASQSPYSLVSRLFRRHPEIIFQRPYHAMIDDSVEQILQREPDWQVLDLPDVAILHEGYQPTVIADRNKGTKARQIMEGFLAKHPNDPYVCSKLGALYIHLGEVQQGLDLLQRGLQAVTIDPATRYELHYHLGTVYADRNEPLQADEHYQAAIEVPILDKLKLGAIHNWATLRQNHGDLETAQWLYEEALKIDPTLTIAHYNLGMTLKAMGHYSAAIEHYQTAIELQPDYAEAHQNLGVALMKLGQIEASLKAFKTAIDLHEKQASPEAQRLTDLLQSMGFQV